MIIVADRLRISLFRIVLAVLILGSSMLVGHAKGLADLVGEYQGLLLYSQGENTRIIGTVSVKVASSRSGTSGRILLKGKIGEDDFRSIIKIKKRSFTMSSLLPGIDGFGQKVSGKTRVKSQSVALSAELSGEINGEGEWNIGFDPFGGILVISGKVTPEGGDPVFVSFTAG